MVKVNNDKITGTRSDKRQHPKLQGMLIKTWALASITRKYLTKKNVLHWISFYHKCDAFNGTWKMSWVEAKSVFRSAVELTRSSTERIWSQEGGSSFGHSLFSWVYLLICFFLSGRGLSSTHLALLSAHLLFFSLIRSNLLSASPVSLPPPTRSLFSSLMGLFHGSGNLGQKRRARDTSQSSAPFLDKRVAECLPFCRRGSATRKWNKILLHFIDCTCVYEHFLVNTSAAKKKKRSVLLCVLAQFWSDLQILAACPCVAWLISSSHT